MTAKREYRPIPVLRAPTPNAALILYCRAVLLGMTDNLRFPSPPLSLSEFAADIDAFADAEAVALTRARGAAAARDTCRVRVMDDLLHLRDYVHGVVVEMAPEDALVAIKSAGMSAKKRYQRGKAELSVTRGPVSGSVLLSARTVAQTAVYYWEVSLDKTHWAAAVPETLQASTLIEGLTPVTTYYFRFRARTRKGLGNYSQVVSFVVL